MTQLSTSAYQEWGGSPYVTCMLTVFDLNAGMLTYTNAGHPPGLLAGAAGTRLLTRGGPPAGLLPGARFEEERLSLYPGDVCLLVSDGVTEAIDDSAQLERDLAALSAPARAASATEICEVVMASAAAGHGPVGVDQWEDDRTVVVARVQGGGINTSLRTMTHTCASTVRTTSTLQASSPDYRRGNDGPPIAKAIGDAYRHTQGNRRRRTARGAGAGIV
jgi:hypothetical protein